MGMGTSSFMWHPPSATGMGIVYITRYCSASPETVLTFHWWSWWWLVDLFIPALLQTAKIHHEVVRLLLWGRLLTGSLLQTLGIWYVLYLKVVPYLWNCNRSPCSRHEAASKDFSKIGCGCLWSLSTVTFAYGNVLTELRAGKKDGWALFLNLCIMLLNLWQCHGSKGNHLPLLQLGGSKAFFTDVTFYGYFFFLVIVLQDKMYFLILPGHS